MQQLFGEIWCMQKTRPLLQTMRNYCTILKLVPGLPVLTNSSFKSPRRAQSSLPSLRLGMQAISGASCNSVLYSMPEV